MTESTPAAVPETGPVVEETTAGSVAISPSSTAGPLSEILPRPWGRRLAALLLLAGAIYLGRLIFSVAIPFLLAWIAAYLVNPLVDLLDVRFGLKRNTAVLLTMGFVALLVVILVAVTIPIVIQESSLLADSFPSYQAKVMDQIALWQQQKRIPEEAEQIARQALAHLQESAPQIASAAGAWLYSWLGSLLGIIGFVLNFLLFVFIFYFFLVDFHDINANLIAAVPAKHRPRLKDLLDEIDLDLRAVLRGQFMVATALAVIYGIGLSIAGVPYAILIGIAAGYGYFLPYVGPILGITPAFLFVALHAAGDLNAMLWQFGGIAIVLAIAQGLEGFVLTPKLAGGSVGLGPVAVLFALSVGGVLLGLVGVVAALPIAAVVKVLLKRGWRLYTESEFYKQPA